MATAERIAAWMRRQLAASAAKGFVVGLSGGIDSAVVARLAQLAAPGAVVGVLLPCHSDPRDEADAMAVATHFSMPTTRIDLSAAYDALSAAVSAAVQGSHDPHGPLANMKPRLRMTALYFAASTLNALVAGTGNRSELAIGYFTKYGDGGVDLLPIAHLVKREVVALARDLNVPQAIIDRAPSAGLWAGQRDEDEMGFTYAGLERYLAHGAEAVAPALAMKIERMMRASEHKRQLPLIPDQGEV